MVRTVARRGRSEVAAWRIDIDYCDEGYGQSIIAQIRFETLHKHDIWVIRTESRREREERSDETEAARDAALALCEILIMTVFSIDLCL